MDSKSFSTIDFPQLIPGYLQRREQDIVELRKLARETQFEAIAFLAHKLKGNGAAYGFPAISRIGTDLETAARSQDLRRVEFLIEQLHLICSQLKGESRG